MIHHVVIKKFKQASLRLKAILLLLIMLGGVVVAGVVSGYGQNNNSTGQLIALNLAQSNYNSSTKVFLDSSGNNNNATSFNTAIFTDDYNGKSNSAMLFNGNTDNIPLPTLSNPDAITIAAWIKIDPNGYTGTHRMILSEQPATYLSIYNKKVFLSLSLDGAQKYFEGSLIVPADEWHFVAVTWNKTDGRYRTYLDGTMDLNAVLSGSALGAFNTGKVGQWYNGNYPFKGAIAGVKVYSRALSQEELLQLYKESKPKLTVSSLEKGLVGYWPLDGENYNTSTSRVTDKSAYGKHGTNVGAILTSDRFGKSNGAMQFNGLDSRISINYQNPVKQTSVVAWFKRTGLPAGDYHIVTGGGSVEISINESGGGFLRTGVYTTTQGRRVFNSGSGLTNGQWHQVAFTYDGTNLRSFIDGQITATNPVSGDLSGTAQEIGRYLSNTYVANGAIADVRIYNRAVSENEILLLYNSNKPKSSSSNLNKGLIMDMPLTSKYTKTNTPGSQIMTDLSPYSRDGQNYGGVVSSEGTLLANAGNRIATTLTTPNKEGTISIWYKPTYSSIDPARNAVLYTSGASWVNNSFEYALRSCCGTPYDNIIYMTDATGTNLRFEWDNPSWQANEWINLTVVYKSRAYIKPYINGVLAQPNSGPNTGDFNFPSTFFVGARSAGNTTAKGTVSNLKIYDRPLSADEVKLLFEKGRGKSGAVINGL